MSEAVYILGAGRTDFKRNAQREGKGMRELITEAGRAALQDAGVDGKEIDAGLVANFAGGLFTRQLHLGALLTEVDPGLHGKPTFHVEAACASGGVAVLTAARLVFGGIHDLVLVVGVEQQKTMSPAQGAVVLGAAADFQSESAEFGDFMFPRLFGRIAQAYMDRYGLAETDLALVSVKNRAHARLNPLAQMRESPLSLKEASTVSETNLRFAPPLKTSDCSQITDGAAAVVLGSARALHRLGKKAGVHLLGYGHATDYLPLSRKDAPTFSVATAAAHQAYSMAGLKPSELHGAEVHDCFSISELVAYEVLGFADRGQGAKLLQTGATALPQARAAMGSSAAAFSLPVNAGGGLIGDGHPVGATGVRQVAEIYQQLTGTAGPRQIEGARRMLAFNMGGSFTTNVVTIWAN